MPIVSCKYRRDANPGPPLPTRLQTANVASRTVNITEGGLTSSRCQSYKNAALASQEIFLPSLT
jgi:hypothetical protein